MKGSDAEGVKSFSDSDQAAMFVTNYPKGRKKLPLYRQLSSHISLIFTRNDKVTEKSKYSVEKIRRKEYPMLKDTVYLDHAGTTIPSRSLIQCFSQDLVSHLYGNPHSDPASSQLVTNKVSDARREVLRFLDADPEVFDVVFVANATAGLKLIADAFREVPEGFWYGYHGYAHNSLIGVREVASAGVHCFESAEDIGDWMSGKGETCGYSDSKVGLFAWPAQSNLSGQRLPLDWSSQIRSAWGGSVYTLLDASSYVSTSPLSLMDPQMAPDLTVLSFYKIFGYPPLGCLVIRKDAPRLANILRKRKYFGGGTVDAVTCLESQSWHAKKLGDLHNCLEDGTLPFQNIIALGHAFATHKCLYGSMQNVAMHTFNLAQMLYGDLTGLCHTNGTRLASIYSSSYTSLQTQGPIVAFNLLYPSGRYIPRSIVERKAAVHNIQIRSGGMCNPGGVASSLGYSSKEIKNNFETNGIGCGVGPNLVEGRPNGVLRVSLGAMSSHSDIHRFIYFVLQTFIDCAENIMER